MAPQMRGHSLFELAMVLSLLAIVAAIAAPRFARAERNYRVEAAAQRIVADLDYISRTARARASSHAVTFSLTSHSYSSSAKPLNTSPDQAYVVRLDHPPYRASLVSVSLGGDQQIIFNSHGMPDSSGEIVVAVGARSRRVLIDAASGEVSVE